MLRVRVCGGVEVEAEGRVLPDVLLAGRQGRLVLAYLVCERHRAVRREELAELLWSDRLPESWPASLSAVISRLRRLFGEAGLDGSSVLVSSAGSYQLHLPEGSSVDIEVLADAAADAEAAAAAGDLIRTQESSAKAEGIASRGFLSDDCEWVDRQRDRVRDYRVRAALALSEAELASGATARAVEAARRALDLDPSRETAYRQLMRTLAAAGERGEALRVWERCRIALIEELGVDPSPETEAVYLEILGATPSAASTTTALPTGVVTFLLTDIVESSGLWEHHPTAMAIALERHDALVGETVAAHGGTLLKSKLEGDATVSVFARATAAAASALALLDAFSAETWPEGATPRLRMAMHTGEAFERGGDYFGPALNRAARLRSLAGPGQVLLSQAVAEMVRDHVPADVVLLDEGHRELRGLSRGEHVFRLARAAAEADVLPENADLHALSPPPVPSVLAGAGPFVGRGDELALLSGLWDRTAAGASRAVFIGGEPGVGKSRLAGEVATRAHAAGGLVLYGRCDEDLAAPLQPFIEAMRVLAPTMGPARLRAVRGVDELRRVVPELGELLPEESPAVRADPDTERLALFDAIAQLVCAASADAPVLLVLDDLHWAGKTTLSLLRHLLRGAKDARLLVMGTYRDTELARTHPLAATLTDLRRDDAADRVTLGGLDAEDVAAYLAAVGNTDRALGRELAEVTSGNPFFLIEVLRHVEETGGTWEPGTLPEGVRDATGRRLSRLSDASNDALSVAAVVGTTFDLALVEQVRGADLVDEIAEACQAGLVIEEAGAPDRFRFAHALVRQVLLTELVTLKRLRLHKTIAELLEAAPVGADPDARLADLAYHWYECASTGGATNAVGACRRAADRAMERLAYEEAGDLYAMALQALDVVEDVDEDERSALHLARCDALLTAGDVAAARVAIDALEHAAQGSERMAAWYTTYAGQLAVLAEPDRLTEIVQSIAAAAEAMHAAHDLTGEARAHYVHASALERLGQIGAAERALDAALAAARSAGDGRLADAILAEAPPAALWGPSPVTRASGHCLDVVRVLRITGGAPAVESVALRCQAVLEALRGRTDAARRMIGSALRTVERLGLAHRRLETEVAAGFIELLDGEAAAAETYLRAAYDELRDRGLGGEAAQAAAFLGRALLLQGRDDEADCVAAEAETLAGSDLKAGIAWRDVRAEAAARRGEMEVALTLSREAVDLATATDALLLVADARLTLAAVLRATGDTEAADAEAQRAVEACEAKGATVLAARARGAMRSKVSAPERPATAAIPTSRPFVFTNDAVQDGQRLQAAYRDRDWDAITGYLHEDFQIEDRRSVVSASMDRDQAIASNRMIYDGGGQFEYIVVGTRGQYSALRRCNLTIPLHDADESVLVVSQVDAVGRNWRSTLFNLTDVDAAFDELDRFYVAHEASEHAAIVEHLGTFVAALGEWTGEVLRIEHFPRLSSNAGVWVVKREVSEQRWVQVFTHDGAGVLAFESFDGDLDAALARYDEIVAGPPANEAWRAALRQKEASDRRDRDAFLDTMAPNYVQHDTRAGFQLHFEGDEALEVHRVMFALDDWEEHRTLVATRGEHLALLWERISFVDGDVGPSEVANFILLETGPDGRVVSQTAIDLEESAFAALDARYAELGGPSLPEPQFANAAWRAMEAQIGAANARDWEAFIAVFSPQFENHDRRSGGELVHVDQNALVAYRVIWEIDECRLERSLVATRGDHLALARTVATFRDGAAGPSEVSALTLIQVDDAGRAIREDAFDVDDLEGAFDELDARYVDLGGPDLRTYRHAYDVRDWEAYRALFHPDCVVTDQRTAGWGTLTRDEFVESVRRAWELEPDIQWWTDHVVSNGNATLVVARAFGTQDGGPWELPFVTVSEIDADGRTTSLARYELADIDTARARFEELAAESTDKPQANTASATGQYLSCTLDLAPPELT